MSRRLICAGAAFALSAVFALSVTVAAWGQRAISVAEQARIESVINSLGRGEYIGQTAVSPNGQWLAWVQGGRGGERIRVAPLEHADQRMGHSWRVMVSDTADCNEDEIAWAPDSHELAFMSDCADTGRQDDLYIVSVDGTQHAARRLTTLHGYVAAPVFSPDGKRIAFLYVKGSMRQAGALAAETPRVGVIGKQNAEVQRVAFVAASATKPKSPVFYTPANLHVFEFDWSPDSRALAYVAADPPGENNWWVAKLYTQRLNEAPKVILAPAKVTGPLHGLQIAAPRWSLDGRQIVFIGGLMSDQGVTGGDVWMVPGAGGAAHDLTPGMAATASWLEWDGNRQLFVDEIAGGNCRLVRMSLTGNGGEAAVARKQTVFSVPGTVGDGRSMLSLSSSSDRSVFVFVGSSFNRAPEIYAVHPDTSRPELHSFGEMNQLTHINNDVRPEGGKTISLDWTNEGFSVQGWLMLPRKYDPAKKYPMIVEVHGGPAAAKLSRWDWGGPLSPEAFSALGYFVLMPNPRGSFGQGERFTQANRRDFGHGDLRDILAGVDTVLAKYPVDANRVGITGWSYGGFMSMFAVTQTQRFRAAVAGAGISDWLSYYGENQIDQWMIPYFGASVYDDPQVYAKSSAINFIRQAHTPTLVVVGDRDGECPAPQSFEFWHALRALHVPSELVVYPDEGHGFRNPAHTKDVLERAARWFAAYMPARQ